MTVKTLIYDIETTPVLAWVWRCGDQVVRHNQLHTDFNITRIICVTYTWLDSKDVKALVFDINSMDDSKVIADFDKLVAQADVIIGKNNVSFDNKHVNFSRFRNGLPPLPEWSMRTDDLERQMRKHFNMQSYSLDYFSSLLGLGGKVKMELDDWIQIVQHKNKSRLKKMVDYGKKDVADTKAIIKKVWPHVTPRFNHATHHGDIRCINCGSTDIVKNGTRVLSQGKTKYQMFRCNAHHGYAGKIPLNKSGQLSKSNIGS